MSVDMWCDNCEESMDHEGDNPAGVCDVCWHSYQADKAVLAAMAAIHHGVLRIVRRYFAARFPAVGTLIDAEFARRGLKS